MESVLLIICPVLVAIPLAVHLMTLTLAAWRYRGAEPPVRPFLASPPVTLIRPVRGLDPAELATLASTFKLDYPNLEILFCAAEGDDPALPFIRDLMAARPKVNARILVGDRHFSGNPKLNNVEKGWEASTGEIVVMTDSNLMLPEDYIWRLVERFEPGVGMVSGPPIGRGAENVWAAVECAFLNTNQARWQLAADALGHGFAQGKTLAYRRDVLEAGGGVQALAGNLAEDVASTKMVRAQGLRVRLTNRLYDQPVPKRTPRTVWARQLRWSQIRREGFPLIFLAEILQGPLLSVVGLAGLWSMGALPDWTVPILLCGWYGMEWGMARLAGWPSGLRDLFAMILRDLLLPVVWYATWFGGGLTWQGQAVTRKKSSRTKGHHVRT
ncbi:glycosyltransferase [Pseudooceanicola sp. CBS1P-1]|uniref:Glycosyltransferase n=1 Tax=Pseudooceanicola albus TaxID=2692189 RepID=A0A6L7G6L1_9RHOB|nr:MULTISPECIES: ceramide glucosyltransferase [Pseudooceanicola]MBT9382979.1 glycosyltransferase [Pseudooceanicola endophyticus]MXN19167.1 glycosyltransferase [Pseudooceanicola albus]